MGETNAALNLGLIPDLFLHFTLLWTCLPNLMSKFHFWAIPFRQSR